MRWKLLVAALLFAASPAFADSTVPALTAGTTLTGTVLYGAQGGTLDRKFGMDTTLFGIATGNITINTGSLGNALLTNPSVTVNSVSCTLGGSCAVTVSIGSGVTGLGTGVATALAAALNSSTGVIGALTPTLNNCVVGNGSAWASTTCPGGGGGISTVTGGGNTTTGVTTLAMGTGFTSTPNGASATATVNLTPPIRTAASPTLATTDFTGQVNISSGGFTIPVSVFTAASQGILVVNYGGSTAALTNTSGLTVNAGGGCVAGTGIPAAASWSLAYNGTSLDCVQTVSSGGAGSGITFTDGTHTVTGSTQLTVTGGTVGGTTPNATLTITGGGGAITLISTQTASASAFLSWTGLTGTDYQLRCRNIIPATSAENIYVQFGTGGTPTWVVTGYQWGGVGATAAGSAVQNGNTSDIGIAMSINTLGNASEGLASAHGNLYNLSSTAIHSGDFQSFSETGGGGQLSSSSAGDLTSPTTAVTAVRVIMQSGNITSGSCSLYSVGT